MIYILLSIVSFTGVVLLFRAFPTHKVNSFQAIVFNYFTCSILALLTTPIAQLKNIPTWDGLWYAASLGAFFVFLFYLIARTTQILGVAVASVSQKLSFIIPVIAGIFLYNESAEFLKILGICLGVLSVFLISGFKRSKEKDVATDDQNLVTLFGLPLIVFLGCGLADFSINYIQDKLVKDLAISAFIGVLFSFAFLAGIIITLVRRVNFERKNLFAGLILGFPNYASVYFLVLALQRSGLESSQVFPINNIGIILSAALAGYIFYKEKLKPIQLLGLLIAIFSILILL